MKQNVLSTPQSAITPLAPTVAYRFQWQPVHRDLLLIRLDSSGSLKHGHSVLPDGREVAIDPLSKTI